VSTYRVGHHQPQNVYRGDAYIGVMFTAEDAALAVEALNEVERVHGPALSIAIPTREGWGPDRLHPTCADVSALNEQPGSAWICTSACRSDPAASATAPAAPARDTGR
jgi:hypothetical protein